MTRLWEARGRSKGGNAVTIRVRAADYFEARRKAAKTQMVIRDLVLIERPQLPKGAPAGPGR